MLLTGKRQSNFELLRILAMLFILIGHANSVVMGMPSSVEILSTPISSVTRIFFMSISIGGVNIFVLISGWFGIRASKKGLLKYAFQVFFLLWCILLWSLLTRHEPLTVNNLKISLGLTGEYWFVMAYLGLYILSPVLNLFIQHTDKQLFQKVLIAFYLFQCYYSWIGGFVSYFEGYSVVFFCGLYLTAAYIRRYPPKVIENYPFTVYFTLSWLIVIIVCASIVNVDNAMKMLRYDSPLVIIASIGLLVGFSKISFHNTLVNWFATSSFAVYIVHFNPFVFSYFKTGVKLLNSEFHGPIYILMLGFFLIAVYMCCILLDQPRILIWNLFCRSK